MVAQTVNVIVILTIRKKRLLCVWFNHRMNKFFLWLPLQPYLIAREARVKESLTGLHAWRAEKPALFLPEI
jgi:hypothetical protein